MTEPSFALSVFRLTPPIAESWDAPVQKQRLNNLNEEFYKRLSSREEIYLTKTKLNDVVCIRFAIGAVRTKQEHVDHAWAILQEEAEVATKDWIQEFDL